MRLLRGSGVQNYLVRETATQLPRRAGEGLQEPRQPVGTLTTRQRFEVLEAVLEAVPKTGETQGAHDAATDAWDADYGYAASGDADGDGERR